MPITINDLVRTVDPRTEAAVDGIRLRYNQAVRHHLRTETRLHLSTAALSTASPGDDAREFRSVRVHVETGIPTALDEVRLDDDLRLALDIAPLTADLRAADQRLGALVAQLQPLHQREDFRDRFGTPLHTLEAARAILAGMLAEGARARLAGQILAIDSDVLGCYLQCARADGWQPGRDQDRTRIELYWGVIGLVARLLDIPVEGLALKVLVHELAHAYTHLGADADGGRWHDAAFWRTDVALVEGLAQYYTVRVLSRMQAQEPAAWLAYERLLPHQHAVYRAHLPWLQAHTPEEVREAMLTVRARSAGGLAEFEALLQDAKARRRARPPG